MHFLLLQGVAPYVMAQAKVKYVCYNSTTTRKLGERRLISRRAGGQAQGQRCLVGAAALGTRQQALTPAPALAVAAADNLRLSPVPAGIDGEGTFKKVCQWQVDFTP